MPELNAHIPALFHRQFDFSRSRQFIEGHSDLCGTGAIWKYIFVRQRGEKDGVLVVPIDDCYVKYAA